MRKIGFSASLLAASTLFLPACLTLNEPAGPVEHMTRTIDLDKAESTRIRLKIGVGSLTVRGGATKLLDASFAYNIPSWKPQVVYSLSGSRSQIDIEQPGVEHTTTGKQTYEWDLQLNDAKPVSLSVELGAGDAHLNLGTLNLENLDLSMGVGQLTLDLRGTPSHDYRANIKGGVGEATVYLPQKAGIVAYASGGLGAIDSPGLHKRGDRFVNDAYENNAKPTVRLDISGGIGAIHLVGN